MGTYLATGIVQQVSICKKDVDRRIQVSDIVTSLGKELDIDKYVFSESDDYLFWNIKPEMLEGNFVEFLETQFNMYGGIENTDIQEVISRVKEARTGEKIIEMVKKKSHPYFQMIDYIFESLKVLDVLRVDLNYHLIAFFIDGKIIMECYKRILRYFETNIIRLQADKYPVVTCLKTMITS